MIHALCCGTTRTPSMTNTAASATMKKGIANGTNLLDAADDDGCDDDADDFRKHAASCCLARNRILDGARDRVQVRGLGLRLAESWKL